VGRGVPAQAALIGGRTVRRFAFPCQLGWKNWQEIAFRSVSVDRERGIVAGRAQGRIAFERSEHGADLFAFNLVLSENLAICHRRYVFLVSH
jgi:hypothetical protein